MKNKLKIITSIFCILLMAATLASCAKKEKLPSPAVTTPEISFEERLSALAPYTPPEELERYWGGAVGEFIPSDDYGRVYPYIGQVQEISQDEDSYYEDKDYWYTGSLLYGFVDEKGRIICDPVYKEAELLTYENKNAYIMHKIAYPQGIVYDEGITWIIDEQYSVISAYGSFAGIYEDVYTGDFFNRKSYEYIAVKKDGLWGAIDYDGTEILPCQYFNAPLFSEGLAAVFENSNFEHNYGTYNYSLDTYYYINPDGDNVLGPFLGPSHFPRLDILAFSHGRALSFDSDFYGFIDTYGNLVIPKIYTNNIYDTDGTKGYHENSLAIVCIMEEDGYGFNFNDALWGLIDVNGKYIVPLRKATSVIQEGDYYSFYYDNRESYESSEKEIFNYTDGKITIINEKSKETLNAWHGRCLDGDIFITDSGIINIKTNEVYYNGEIPPFSHEAVFQLDDGRSCIIGYKYGSNAPKFGVMDKNGPILDFEYDALKWVGGYFCAAQGDHGGLLRPDGTWFVKVKFEKLD